MLYSGGLKTTLYSITLTKVPWPHSNTQSVRKLVKSLPVELLVRLQQDTLQILLRDVGYMSAVDQMARQEVRDSRVAVIIPARIVDHSTPQCQWIPKSMSPE